jgi:hypothetical protein
MNLIFAIGAQYSHLINAVWAGDERDHRVYMNRAIRLLGLKDTLVVISGPDLRTVQAVSPTSPTKSDFIAPFLTRNDMPRPERCLSTSSLSVVSVEHGS